MTWEEIKATVQQGHTNWKSFFDERQLKEIEFDRIYADRFSHGTDGHNARLIIAKMAALLDLIDTSRLATGATRATSDCAGATD